MMRLLRRPEDLACQQVVELITDYLEGALSRTERRRVESHLRGCANCTTYLEQMRITIQATGSLQVEDLDPEILREFTDLFRGWTAEQDGPAG
jgi:anti-sigma factor RsiW